MALNNNPTANEVVKAIKDLEKPATTGNIGLVKPDGISITIDNDGTIRSQNSGTLTSITAGTGLSGGTITTSGTIALSSETQASLEKADSAVQPGDLGTLASQNSIDYTSNQITNKPTIPTTTNELTNNSGFITNAVNNLTNYYKKTETYTQTEIDSLIANIKTITAEIVTSLPTASSTTYFNTSKKIYLVLANNDSDDFYNEYITILKDSEYFWEKIGDTKIDLTDYVKNTDYANTSKGGVVIVNNDNGVGIRENGVLQVVPATTAEIDAKTQGYKPIVPNTLDYAIEKGLGANSLTWTDTEKLNARNTIGAGTSNFSGDYNDLTNKLTSVNGLNGGNIKGTSGDTPLTVQSALQSTFIGFKNSSGSTLGYLGVNNNKRPVFYDSTTRELALKSDVPNVSQSTGTSTTEVMSQKATTDELNAIITALSNKFTNHPQSAYDCNTCYDEGVYLIARGSNCPSGTQYGSLFVMPYRKPTGNTKPDFCVQIYLPNGDDSTHPNSMFYRTSLADSWNNWKEVASISDVQAKIDNLQTQINNMLNGTTTFTYLKAKIVDLV